MQFFSQLHDNININIRRLVIAILSKTRKFDFIKRVDKSWITTMKDLESSRFERLTLRQREWANDKVPHVAS